MIAVTVWTLLGAGLVAQVLAWMHRIEPFWAPAVFAVANAVIAILDVMGRNVAWAMISTGCAVISALVAWMLWNRRKRRRAPRTLGAKSRARIAAMVTRMRERPARPVLRPVEGGAR